MTPASVVIVGAGPVGLVLGCELARRDVPFRLIDKATEPFGGSRGKTLQPRTLELMDDLGIVHQILVRGEYTPPILSYLQDGGILVEEMFGDRRPTPDIPYPRPFTAAQNTTEEILRRRLAELGGRIDYGTELIALDQADEKVTLTLATASGGETVETAYVVGCDGGRSLVRRLLGIPFDGDTDDSRRIYVADVRLAGLDRSTWHSFRGPPGMLNLAPLATTDLFQCQAAIPPDAPDQPTAELLQTIITQRTRRDDIRLLDMPWASPWRLNVRLAARYRVGRAFLAGDACHVHSPAGAQGLNTGVQDAYNLGWKLAAVLSGAPPDLLDSYEAERRPFAAWMLGMTSALEEQAFEKKGFPADREESQLHLLLNYRDSMLSQDYRAEPASLLAGDRIPDLPGLIVDGERLRLFDLLRGPAPVMLAFGRAEAERAALLRQAYAPDRLRILTIGEDADVADPDGRLAAALGVAEDTVLIVRPDKYLGLAAGPSAFDRIEPYLRQTMGLGSSGDTADAREARHARGCDASIS